jgi:hypothetical protein
MNEIQRIKANKKGEIPNSKYDILRVDGIENPEEILENFKKGIITILENSNLNYNDKKWESLLPKKIVNIVNQFDEQDYKNDDLVFSISSMVYDVQKLKDWQWYSSKLSENSFQVIFEGIFRGGFTSFVRFQGIPLSKITIERNGIIYPLKVRKDVMTYKKFK